MIEDNIKKEIMRRIKKAESEFDVKVLYAVESGSRAWGFESPNSDYDVRFIYVHKKDWYLSIDLESKRDVIEYEIVDEVDINGWEIRKALQLLYRSNPTIVEWLHSPIVYVDDEVFSNKARALLSHSYCIDKGIFHYRSMANTNYRSYLKQDLVPLKKYFYVLRPLLSIMWLEKYKQPAPIEFDTLLEILPEQSKLTIEINKLVARKKLSLEKESIPAVLEINQFIEKQLNRLSEYKSSDLNKDNVLKDFNAFFVECLK
ncbi:nucleotidyltransferase domain-containing protein [Marinicellulosiphila megalodicopiae]|uniref:nucleotidyltransferase domain-containing protein n=1 Tax=Marinicellulosiphila megalodicopiae TaxID=2724896 RepID=UPI003BAEE9D9